MYRARRFQAYVAYYLDASWELAAESERSPAVRRYEAHLAAIGRDQPLLLLAHAYTQFLAIASGGQIFRRMVRKQLGLPEDEGTAAFEYDTGPGAEREKEGYRREGRRDMRPGAACLGPSRAVWRSL